MPLSLHGLRTVIYPAPELDAAKAWWTDTLGVEPYFDEPFYVGYNIADTSSGCSLTAIRRTAHSPIGALTTFPRQSVSRWPTEPSSTPQSARSAAESSRRRY